MTEKKVRKPTKDTVYVDVDDDITAIIDKVETAKRKVVALVLPKRTAALQSIVNMRLLKRSADSADKNLVLITGEASLMPLAGATGLHVAKTLHSKPEIPDSPLPLAEKPKVSDDPDTEVSKEDSKLDYHRSIGGLAAATAVDEPEAIPIGDDDESDKVKTKSTKAPKDKKLKVPNFDRFRNRLSLAIIGGLALIIFIILAIFVWPKATITIKTSSTPVSASFDLVTSDKAQTYDEKNHTIPAILKTSDQTSSQTASATGQQNNGDKAAGSITMSAQDCSAPFNTPADVPAGAGVITGGRTYITQVNTSFVISGASGSCVDYAATGSTAIKAQSGGASYNVSSATFTVAGRSDISATGSASGGTDNIVTVVSQGDIDGAKNKVTAEDTDKFSKTFVKQLSDAGFYVITSTLKTSEPQVTANPAVGQPASSVSVNVKTTHSALVVKKDDLRNAIKDELNKQIDKSKQELSSDDVLKKVAVTVQNQSSPTVATLTIGVDTTAIPKIDVKTIQQKVVGLKSGAIKSIISSYPGVQDVNVQMSPFWVSKAPKKLSKIHIKLVEQPSKSDQP